MNSRARAWLAGFVVLIALATVAMEAARKMLLNEWLTHGMLELVHQCDAADGADALVLVTEWRTFRMPDLPCLAKAMRQRIIFDGRNQYCPSQIRAQGFEYFWIGR